MAAGDSERLSSLIGSIELGVELPTIVSLDLHAAGGCANVAISTAARRLGGLSRPRAIPDP
jgi:hypothetical protein